MVNTENATETGIEKILFHTEKIKEIVRSSEYDSTYPVSVELTLTNKCNLNCIYCSDKKLRQREGNSAELTVENLKALFFELKRGGTKGVVIEGGGEPTLHKDFEKIIYIAKKIGLSVGLITNGTSDINSDLLAEFQWIRVSLDASNREEYIKIKGVDKFEEVLSNVEKYKAVCPVVGVGYVVTKDNINDLNSITVRLRDIGVNYIQFRPVVDCEELVLYDYNFEYLERLSSEGFTVDISGFKNNSYNGNGGVACCASSLTSVISGDGNVYICGRLNIYSWLKPIGNIKHESFDNIWNGEERKKQIGMISDAEFCQKYCPQCRISKFNLFFEKIKRIETTDFI